MPPLSNSILLIGYFLGFYAFFQLYFNTFKLWNIKDKSVEVKKYFIYNLFATLIILVINIINNYVNYNDLFTIGFTLIIIIFIFFCKETISYKENIDIGKKNLINIVVSSGYILVCLILLIIGAYLKNI